MLAAFTACQKDEGLVSDTTADILVYGDHSAERSVKPVP